MNYQETVDYISGKRRFGSASGREVSTALLKELGNPEQGMRIIHIAGTNGKGSCASFLSYMLCNTGMKTALFTSPHLISFRERIRVLTYPESIESNDPFTGMISEEDVVRYARTVLEAEKHIELQATMFDICLAMALLYFRDQNCDAVVLETGLGGRLDSTRGISVVPEVCVITNIGLEHTRYLGTTVEQIAGEKAGILRAGTKAVIGAMHEKAREVIVDTCRAEGIPFRDTEDEIRVIENCISTESDFNLGLKGTYQKQNAAAAVTAYKLFFGEGYDEAVIREGLAKTRWPGRMQVLSRDPYVLVDGAHNPEGVRALAGSLAEAFPGERFTFICAMMSDKDHITMMGEMSPLAKKFIVMKAPTDRSADPERLLECGIMLGVDSAYAHNIESAMEIARESDNKIVVFGSLYFIAEVLQSSLF